MLWNKLGCFFFFVVVSFLFCFNGSFTSKDVQIDRLEKILQLFGQELVGALSLRFKLIALPFCFQIVTV